MTRIILLACAAHAAATLLLLDPIPSLSAQAPQAGGAPPAAGYVGEATCVACHESEGPEIGATAHGRAANPRTPAAAQGCESCHGPGEAHVADPLVPGSIRRFEAAARDASAACLTCHTRGSHALWRGSAHDARNLSCSTCHAVHAPRSERAQLKTATAMDTCATCHRQQTAKIQRSAHMPLREGKMECTSCHDPHGATNVRLLKAGNWITESCVSCHTEKRGPFLWEHAAGREACSSCHDPHGSNNDRMLVAKQPMLCQRCHIGTRHPSTIYDANQLASRSNRLIGRSCVNCHSQIHGSNSPAGHAFIR